MEPRIENPWHKLPPGPPYVLADEEEPIAKYNSRAKPIHFLHLELVPEPYLGNPDAPVVILNLNPGFSDDDPKHHADPVFANRAKANLLHEPSEYPFFFLDPKLSAPGCGWRKQRLRPLTDAVGLETVARKVLCVEFFPYHSVTCKHPRHLLPSQQYSFELVRRAISRGALILKMRSFRKWLEAVPELGTCRNVYRASNYQSPHISPRNFLDGFPVAVQILKAASDG